MPKRMLVHDRRLEGNAPTVAQNTYVVGMKNPTAHVIAWVGQYARSQGGLDELIIMCHGITVTGGRADPAAQMTRVETVGASGLQLGREGLNITNVGLTARWRPNVRRIYLYACSVARGSSRNNPRFDGARFCGEMALHSGAEVYASDQTQMYTRIRTRWQDLIGTNVAGTIDFGSWEGTVYSYSPATGQPSVVTPGRAHR